MLTLKKYREIKSDAIMICLVDGKLGLLFDSEFDGIVDQFIAECWVMK